jgi:hypothetical protein
MRPYVLTYAKEHRAEIYGELLGLALRRDGGFKIPSDYDTCRFVDWVKYAVPVVQPVFGPLAIKAAEDLDDRVQDLFMWGNDHIDEAFTANALYDEVIGNADQWAGLAETVTTTKSKRAQQQKMARLLKNMTGKSQQVAADVTIELRRIREPTKKEAAQYMFVRIEE